MAGLLGISKAISIPAASALLSYLNAKYGIGSDLNNLWTALVVYTLHMKRQEKIDRLNLFYTLEERALDHKTAESTFLVVPKDTVAEGERAEWTYSEAYDNVLRYAAWLKNEHGIQKGEVIAMDFTNRPQFVWLWFALWSLGAIPAFINTNLRDQAFVHSVRISTARLLLVHHDIREILTQETLNALSADDKGRAVDCHILDPQKETEVLALEPYRAPDEIRSGATADSTCLLIYTSGTTGLPKAAHVSWTKPYAGKRLYSTLCGIRKDDTYLTALPLYHSSGSVLGVMMVVNTGATVVVVPKFSPRTFMRYVSETKATGIQYIGEMCRYLVSSPASPNDRAHNIRFAFGNGMRGDIWQEFKDRFNIGTIVEFYAATEAPSTSFISSRNDFLRGTIGRQGAIIRNLLQTFIIVKHDHMTDEPFRDSKTGLCVQCKADEAGELLHPLDPADINSRFQGYYGNSKASQSKILRDVFAKGDAYYRTGDLIRRDRDGRAWFVDRVGDTFRWKSENVSTAEVSEAVGSHPQVNEANVYGVQLPNHDGRAGCAAIVLANDQKLDDRLAKDLAGHTKKRLPKYAVPIFLRLRKHVEVTGTLKHQKVELRNEGVDPNSVGEDQIYWLEPGAERYTLFDEKNWKRIVAGDAKL